MSLQRHCDSCDRVVDPKRDQVVRVDYSLMIGNEMKTKQVGSIDCCLGCTHKIRQDIEEKYQAALHIFRGDTPPRHVP